MKEVFYRVRGRYGDSEPRLVYDGCLISISDIKRLTELTLASLDPEFAAKIKTGAKYAQELLSLIPDNTDISFYDNRIKALIRKTSEPHMNLSQLLELFQPVHSVLKNHRL